MADNIKHQLSGAGMGQPNFATCWWASYRMMYRWVRRGLDTIDTRLANVGIGANDCKADGNTDDYCSNYTGLDYCKENGLMDRQYALAAQALGLTGWRGQIFSADPSGDGLDAFLKELTLGPLWVSLIVSRKEHPKAYHIVVATGYEDAWFDKKIIYNNPFPGPTDALEMKMNSNTFLSHITMANCSVQAYRYHIGDDD